MTARVYLDCSGGLGQVALAAALAPLEERGELAVFCSPLPRAALRFLPAGPTSIVFDASDAMVTEEGVRALQALSPSFVTQGVLEAQEISVGYEGEICVRAMLLARGDTEELCVLAANVDDLNPQLVEEFFQKSFAAGALDVWAEPILMKKGRPAQKLCVLCAPEREGLLREVFFRETSTLGVRSGRVQRSVLPRKMVQVETVFGTVAIKVGVVSGEIWQAHPEYEDCRRCASQSGVSTKRVMAEASAEFWRQYGKNRFMI